MIKMQDPGAPGAQSEEVSIASNLLHWQSLENLRAVVNDRRLSLSIVYRYLQRTISGMLTEMKEPR